MKLRGKFFLVCILAAACLMALVGCHKAETPALGEYATVVSETDQVFEGQRGIASPAYAMGLNFAGEPVFKDPHAALEQFMLDYGIAITHVKTTFDLEPLSANYWKPYKTYGWQYVSNNEDTMRKTADITAFFDIYENSFPPEERGASEE